MSETAAYAGEPSSVLRGKDANDYLERMGLRPVEIHKAHKAGDVASENTPPYAPATAPGLNRWIATVHTMRELLHKRNWTCEDRQNRPTATSSDGAYTLSFVRGDAFVADPDPLVVPKAARRRGPATRAAVQLSLNLASVSNGTPAGLPAGEPPAGAWFLLYYRDEDEIRSEVSLPSGFDPKNEQFTGWTVRVLLEPLKLERPDIRDIGGDDVDFTITDIAEH